MKNSKYFLIKAVVVISIPVLIRCTAPANVSGGNEKTLIIGPETADCTGVAPMKCLQVKETSNGSWVNLYSNIEGFTYEPGYEYVLKVKTEKIAQPPAGGSSVKYILLKQVSKTKK
ncbi:DUF4377 domain-containing protein [Chryseobacterium gossypii]|uniref:DUF4377 domain-containing protein n=1 Tax=Chryseobacterium gossypii TaxID=3231602 RepID=UPI0035236808